MIPMRYIDQVCDHLNALTETKFVRLLRQMRREQPAIYYHLLSYDEGHFSEDELWRMVIIGLSLWQIVKRAPRGLDRVTIQEIARINDEVTLPLIEKLYFKHQGLRQQIALVMVDYPEKDLLQCMVDNLDADLEMPITPENMGRAFIHLKILLDALIARLKTPSATHRARPGNNPSTPPGRRRFLRATTQKRLGDLWLKTVMSH